MHVLCAPPAFILSQDQTLILKIIFFWVLAHYNSVFLVVLKLPQFYWFLKRFIVYFSMYFVFLCGTCFIILYCLLNVNTFFKIFLIFFWPFKGQNKKLVIAVFCSYVVFLLTNSFVQIYNNMDLFLSQHFFQKKFEIFLKCRNDL